MPFAYCCNPKQTKEKNSLPVCACTYVCTLAQTQTLHPCCLWAILSSPYQPLQPPRQITKYSTEFLGSRHGSVKSPFLSTQRLEIVLH